MSKIEHFETGRLLIRELNYEDFASVHRIKSNHDVVRFLTWGPSDELQTREALKKQLLFQEESERTKFVLAIVLKTTHELIGNGLLSFRDEGSAEIGYFFHPDYWGKGYGLETAEALLKLGFEDLKLHRIFATSDVENVDSIKIMRKLGMRQEGYFLKDQMIKRSWRDNVLYAILNEEYLSPEKKNAPGRK